MTSGIFRTAPLADIQVNRDQRQRRDLVNIDELAESIRARGLINPITVTGDLVLVAGERRLEACRQLGWANIPYQLASDLSPDELHAIELEENIKRVDLSWQDRARAISDYHNYLKAKSKDWSMEKTGEAMGWSGSVVQKHLLVAAELGNPKVATAPKFSVAHGIVDRQRSRKAEAAVAGIRATAPKSTDGPGEIIQADFLKWSQTYDGPHFNLLHCDFPYGINADKFDQGSAAAHGGYADTPEHYFDLIDCLLGFADNHCHDSCHLVFWFSMAHYTPTLERLSAGGWRIEPFPLVWMKSDNVGILPDPQRGPRRIYETALLGSRGDRKVVSAVANAFAGPTSRNIHMSEKPQPMLAHFLRMLVDESTSLLDPTAGSGSAIRAAEHLKATRALGLEVNPEFAKLAQDALAGSRKK